MGKSNAAKDERQAQIAALRAQQRKADQRRTRLIVGISVLVSVALVVVAGVVIIGEQRRQSAIQAAAEAPIEGVVEIEGLSATHVTTDVEYEQDPPAGGDHDPTWQSCGFYTEPVVEENAVHSLEHGAVWVTYSPDLPAADVDRLDELTRTNPYLLVSPVEDLTSPLVATAWGLQLELDSVEDERLQVFLTKYLQGPQTLEPGASCAGGIG